jgi:hypothetical protein
MTFKPAIWFPISLVLTAVNLAGVGFAAASSEPWHASIHAALAVAFGLWAQHLRGGPRGGGGDGELPLRVDALEGEVGNLRRELNEAQERLDFAERLLAQAPDPRRVGPQG